MFTSYPFLSKDRGGKYESIYQRKVLHLIYDNFDRGRMRLYCMQYIFAKPGLYTSVVSLTLR
jgi:hypothetical protein